jgi:hypothetical protein
MLDLDNVPQVTGRFDHKSFKHACLQKNVNPTQSRLGPIAAQGQKLAERGLETIG